MKILVVYYSTEPKNRLRNTIVEHLFSFEKYLSDKHDVFYLNVFYTVPSFIKLFKFDLIVFHYTVLSLKFPGFDFFDKYVKKFKIHRLKEVSGYKIAMPQDEYTYSEILCNFFKEYGIKTVYTNYSPVDYEKVYPKDKTGLEYYFTVPTGYVDEIANDKLRNKLKKHSDRKIDIGYRARKLSFWYGEFSQIKWQIAEVFNKATKNKGFKIDVSTDGSDVFTGNDWYNFLANCRVMIGCESGASLLDRDGSIRNRVNEFLSKNPNANFATTRDECFRGKDYNISLFTVSPRHFECCITKTCQALVEGGYNGIFKPDVHYIPIKKDYSNIDEVLKKIKDINYCEQMASRAYKDIIESGKYTYKNFVNNVVDHVDNVYPSVCDSGKRLSLSHGMLRFSYGTYWILSNFFHPRVLFFRIIYSTSIILKIILPRKTFFKLREIVRRMRNKDR